MKIVIIENPRPRTVEHYNDVANAPLSASLNAGYALAVARRAGWDTAYLDFTASNQDAAVIAELITAEAADIVLLHWVYSWGYEEQVRNLVELLHRENATPIGAFGLFPTLAGKQLLTFSPPLDYILAGEFEDTLGELLRLFEQRRTISAIPGVVLRTGSFVRRPLISDLSRLPVPDDVGANCDYPSLNVAASRGCHGDCSFCFIHRYYGCSRRRVRDPGSLERELASRLSRRDVKSLYFVDPNFVGPGESERKRISEIARVAKRFGLTFGFEARVDCINAELLAMLVENGATSVFLGIESGCDSVLQRIGKRISTGQIRSAVRDVRDSGLELNLGFIMFEPDSTLAELEENYNFLEELQLLEQHDLTVNLLYHNQIVLYGSTAWERFRQEERLLLDERLPFEARYRFRDERVGHVCAALGQLAWHYFRGLESIRRKTFTKEDACGSGRQNFNTGSVDINYVLKSVFRSLCHVAKSGSPLQIEQAGLEYAKMFHNTLEGM